MIVDMGKQIIIKIPIQQQTRQEIASALWDRYGVDYVLLGRILQETKTSESCEIKISPQTVYLVSNQVGYNACLKIARFTQVLIQISGLVIEGSPPLAITRRGRCAIAVESAGIAHGADKWLCNYNSDNSDNSDDILALYHLFVGLVEGENSYYSCGMHNFGKADAAVEITADLNLAVYVLNVFNYYRLTQSPILQEGHTFQPDLETPRYQIRWLKDDEHEMDSPQFNPYGRWCLDPIFA
jgi:hypothetical protein